jgi:hypothetical protein
MNTGLELSAKNSSVVDPVSPSGMSPTVTVTAAYNKEIAVPRADPRVRSREFASPNGGQKMHSRPDSKLPRYSGQFTSPRMDSIAQQMLSRRSPSFAAANGLLQKFTRPPIRARSINLVVRMRLSFASALEALVGLDLSAAQDSKHEHRYFRRATTAERSYGYFMAEGMTPQERPDWHNSELP